MEKYREVIIRELKLVRNGIAAELEINPEGKCAYICPRICYLSTMLNEPIKPESIARRWFESQRPSGKLHPEFFDTVTSVWFFKDTRRVEFLDYLIKNLQDGELSV